METYPDPDDIRKNTADILKALTVDNIPERHGFTAELASLENCISDDEYCFNEFCETGCAFLKALLRTRLRLKRTDLRIRCCPSSLRRWKHSGSA
mgnify:CR=1 FL=1